MIPDYFTNYKHQLEQYAGLLNQRSIALEAFVEAVNLDWETMRTRKALSRVWEFKTGVDEILKRQAQETTFVEATSRLPGDLPTFLPTIRRLVASLIPEAIPTVTPRTTDEVKFSSFLKNPANASLLSGVIEKVLKEIQTTRIPAGMNATAYVDQRLREELGEALRKRNASSSPSGPRYFKAA